MKILVLGASGFIGSHLCEALLHQEHTVRAFSRTLTPHLALLCKTNPNIEWFEGNWSSSQDLIYALNKIDVVFHLISSSSPITSQALVGEFHENITNTVSLLDNMRILNVNRIIYLSSGGAIYGESSVVPIPETAPTNPVSPYGIVKLSIEKIIQMYHKLYGMEYCIVRPSNVFGPRQNLNKKQGVISIFIQKIFLEECIEIWGSEKIKKDYIYIKDSINAIVRLLHSKASGVFNLGSGVGTSLLDIINCISEIHGAKINIIYKNFSSYDVPVNVLDTSKIKSELQWDNEIPIEQGISLTYTYMKKSLNK